MPRIRLGGSAVDRTTDFEIDRGAPNADWVCFIDTSNGPTATPFGTFCFGPTAAILYNSFAGNVPRLDVDGAATISVTLPATLGALEGINFYMQAIVADSTTPLGISISEDESVSFRRPRVFVGTAREPLASLPQSIVSIEASTGGLDFQITPTVPSTTFSFSDLLACSAERCFASLDSAGTVRVLEEGTGAERFAVTTTPSFGQLALGRNGRQLFIDSIAATARLNLTNGTLFSFPTSPGITLIPHPTRNEILKMGVFSVIRYNFVSGLPLPFVPIPLTVNNGGAYTPLVVGQEMFVFTSGARISVPMNIEVATYDLDTDTFTNISPTPLGFGNILSANFAVGASGPGLWLTTLTEIIEVDPVTLTTRQTIPFGGARATVSGGGTELLLSAGSSIAVLDLATSVVTPIATTINNQSLEIAASADHAYFVDNGQLYRMATDPTTTAIQIASLHASFESAVGTLFASARTAAE